MRLGNLREHLDRGQLFASEACDQGEVDPRERPFGTAGRILDKEVEQLVLGRGTLQKRERIRLHRSNSIFRVRAS
jgi:hypothetical protein